MFYDLSAEDQIAKQDKELQELEISLESLQNSVERLYEDLGVTPEQLNAALQKSDNFTPEQWDRIQEEKKAIEERLEKERLNLTNPKNAAESRKRMLEVQRHWIPIR